MPLSVTSENSIFLATLKQRRRIFLIRYISMLWVTIHNSYGRAMHNNDVAAITQRKYPLSYDNTYRWRPLAEVSDLDLDQGPSDPAAMMAALNPELRPAPKLYSKGVKITDITQIFTNAARRVLPITKPKDFCVDHVLIACHRARSRRSC